MYNITGAYKVGDLANEIFEYEYDGDPTLSNETRISGWLDSNIGKLNSRIHTEFCTVSGYFATPETVSYSFGHEEASIYTQMHMVNYYSKATRKVLMGQSVIIPTGTSGSGMNNSTSASNFVGMSDWTEIQEGDTTIKREPLYNTLTGSSIVTTNSSSVDLDDFAKQYRELMNDSRGQMEDLIAAYNIHGAKPTQIS
tara:strand:- start:2898 stop:3488 length:591 start_codon:yes stop_codon:yes gene_type:complete